MEKKTTLDVSKQVRAFIDKFVAKGEIGVTEQSEMVQDFYAEFQERIKLDFFYQTNDFITSEISEASKFQKLC